jgi:hypothetical protein
MQKIKLKILKDHEASPDGIRLNKYKAHEVLELGSARLPVHLYEFYSRNSGYAELSIEEKKIDNAPENKMVKNLQNKSFKSFSEEDSEEIDREIAGSTELSEGKKNINKKK